MAAIGQDMQVYAHFTLTSGLVALFVESLLFGAFTVTYGISTWILMYRSRPQPRSTRDVSLFVASTAMFILSLVHVALDMHIALSTFIASGGDLADMSGSIDMFNSLSDSFGAAKFGIYVTQVLIGDGFMIYRAYVVWDRRWRVVALPMLMLFAQVVIGYYISLSGPLSPDVNHEPDATSCVNALVEAFFILSAATNLLSTGLIMKRILCSTCATRGVQEMLPHCSPLGIRSVRWRVFESILQSAAIYSVASISLAVTAFVSPTVAFPACHSVFPNVIGLVFLLIIIRICANANVIGSSDLPLPRRSMLQGNGSACAGPDFSDVERCQGHGVVGVVPAQPIAIHVSVSTMSDYDRDSVASFNIQSPSIEKVLQSETSSSVQLSPISPRSPVYETAVFPSPL